MADREQRPYGGDRGPFDKLRTGGAIDSEGRKRDAGGGVRHDAGYSRATEGGRMNASTTAAQRQDKNRSRNRITAGQRREAGGGKSITAERQHNNSTETAQRQQ